MEQRIIGFVVHGPWSEIRIYILLYTYNIYIYSHYITLSARCHTVANGATHVLMLTYCNLTEGLLEPTAGDWSRQVSGHDLATLRPLLTFRGIAACRLVELGWMQWAVAKMLETPMLEEKMPEHFRDPQTGDM